MSRPRLSPRGWRYALGRAFREFWLGGGLDMAALLTFFTVLSFAPAVLAVYSIATLVLANNAELVDSLSAEFIADYVPADYRGTVADAVGTVVGSAAGGVIGLIVGIAVALWSSSAYVRAFSRCANAVYRQAEGRPVLRQLATMLGTTAVMLVGLVVILASVMLSEPVVTATLGPLAGPLGLSDVLDYLLGVFLPVWRWVKWPVIVAMAVVLIAVLYYATPNVKQPRFRWLSVGAAVALLGIALVSAIFWLYLSYLTSFSGYGAAGTLLVLLFALWGANAALILGMKIDVEIVRVRQLRSGVEAEHEVRVSPRSTREVEKRDARRERMADRGRDLRERYLAD